MVIGTGKTTSQVRLSGELGQEMASSLASVNCRPLHGRECSAVFDAAYLERLRAGDEETAKHFNGYFRRVLRLKLWNILIMLSLGKEKKPFPNL